MAHTDRQPSDAVFYDMRNAARSVWFFSDFHVSYIEEKIAAIESTVNYADNWCTFIQQFDNKNQLLFFNELEYQDSVDFLRAQHIHYSYILPRIKR